MIRTIYTAVGVVFAVLATIPPMFTMKKKKQNLSKEDFDLAVYKVSSTFGKRMFRLSGSTIEVKGLENMPKGAVLLVSNHQSNFDIPVVLGFLEKPVGFISKVEIKKLPIVRTWMEYMNGVFMDRSDRRKALKSIQDGIQKLKDGHSIVVFPEGTRSKGLDVGEFKSASLRLATRALVPIVPIAIEGTYKILEQNGNRVKPAHVIVEVLPPLTKEGYENEDINKVAEILQHRIEEKVISNKIVK